jgi:predicted RNase H-like nuclease
LRAAGIELPDDLGEAGAAGVDDVLDAAAVAWSAHRIARGMARSLPEQPEPGPDGHAAAIWY